MTTAKPNLSPVRAASSLQDCDEDELMCLAASSSQPAFRTLIERHTDTLIRFCSKLCGDTQAGEDVVQETWIRIWNMRTRYEGKGSFISLLYTTARNLCRNQLRSRRRRDKWLPTISDERAKTNIPCEGADALSTAVERERQRKVLEALGRIPTKHREALLLRFDQDFDYEGMVAITGASASTMRSRVFHGLRRLKKEMKGDSP